MDLTENWTKVYETNDAILAEIITNYLEKENEIYAVMIDKRVSAYNIGLCEVNVPNEYAERARELILAFNQQNGE
jgi:Putative prokaryotic signal transducing protein